VNCTIIIPTKDRPAGLRAAVASAFSALPAGGQVLVVDDGTSPPATRTLAAMTGPAPDVIDNPGPSGAAAARNLGARHARGDVLFFLDDDDAMLPDYPERILAALQGPAQSACFGFSAMRCGNRLVSKRLPEGMIAPDAPIGERLAGLGMGFWIRRGTFEAMGGIDASLSVNEDTEFFLRLAAEGVPGWYSPRPGVRIRPTEARTGGDLASLTSRSRAADRAAAFEHILTRHADFLRAHPAQRLAFARRVVKYRVRADGLGAARGFIRAQESGRASLAGDALRWWLLSLLSARVSRRDRA